MFFIKQKFRFEMFENCRRKIFQIFQGLVNHQIYLFKYYTIGSTQNKNEYYISCMVGT